MEEEILEFERRHENFEQILSTFNKVAYDSMLDNWTGSVEELIQMIHCIFEKINEIISKGYDQLHDKDKAEPFCLILILVIDTLYETLVIIQKNANIFQDKNKINLMIQGVMTALQTNIIKYSNFATLEHKYKKLYQFIYNKPLSTSNVVDDTEAKLSSLDDFSLPVDSIHKLKDVINTSQSQEEDSNEYNIRSHTFMFDKECLFQMGETSKCDNKAERVVGILKKRPLLKRPNFIRIKSSSNKEKIFHIDVKNLENQKNHENHKESVNHKKTVRFHDDV